MSNYYYLDAVFFLRVEDSSENENYNKRLEKYKKEIKKNFYLDFCPLTLKISALLGEKIIFSEKYFKLSKIKKKELKNKCLEEKIIPYYLTTRSNPSSIGFFYKNGVKSLPKIKQKIKSISKKYNIKGEFRIELYHKKRKSYGLFDGHEDIVIDRREFRGGI